MLCLFSLDKIEVNNVSRDYAKPFVEAPEETWQLKQSGGFTFHALFIANHSHLIPPRSPRWLYLQNRLISSVVGRRNRWTLSVRTSLSCDGNDETHQHIPKIKEIKADNRHRYSIWAASDQAPVHGLSLPEGPGWWQWQRQSSQRRLYQFLPRYHRGTTASSHASIGE